MNIVVIGGTGLIGSKLVTLLRQRGQEVCAAAPSTGINTLTSEGLPEALAGARVVVDVANSPSFEDQAVMTFFLTSGKNLLAAEATAGVKHHVALSVVGADRLPDSGYMRAKAQQESLIKNSGIPYTILRATQFFEFGGPIAEAGADGPVVRVPAGAMIQPISSEDVVSVLAEIAVSRPVMGTLEVGGPDRLSFEDFVSQVLSGKKDSRKVIADTNARYFGAKIDNESLVPRGKARIGPTHYDSWVGRATPPH
jgi:uncharacterized protein YbjT (DUF2867 family)